MCDNFFFSFRGTVELSVTFPVKFKDSFYDSNCIGAGRLAFKSQYKHNLILALGLNIPTSPAAYPASYSVGTGEHFPEAKRQEQYAGHSTSSGAEVKWQ
jgi:hypothetical protein